MWINICQAGQIKLAFPAWHLGMKYVSFTAGEDIVHANSEACIY